MTASNQSAAKRVSDLAASNDERFRHLDENLAGLSGRVTGVETTLESHGMMLKEIRSALSGLGRSNPQLYVAVIGVALTIATLLAGFVMLIVGPITDTQDRLLEEIDKREDRLMTADKQMDTNLQREMRDLDRVAQEALTRLDTVLQREMADGDKQLDTRIESANALSAARHASQQETIGRMQTKIDDHAMRLRDVADRLARREANQFTPADATVLERRFMDMIFNLRRDLWKNIEPNKTIRPYTRETTGNENR